MTTEQDQALSWFNRRAWPHEDDPVRRETQHPTLAAEVLLLTIPGVKFFTLDDASDDGWSLKPASQLTAPVLAWSPNVNDSMTLREHLESYKAWINRVYAPAGYPVMILARPLPDEMKGATT